jgi:hypothetical protein
MLLKDFLFCQKLLDRRHGRGIIPSRERGSYMSLGKYVALCIGGWILLVGVLSLFLPVESSGSIGTLAGLAFGYWLRDWRHPGRTLIAGGDRSEPK